MPKRNRAISAPNEETVTGLEPVEPVQKTKKGRTLSQATSKKSKKAKPSRKLGRVKTELSQPFRKTFSNIVASRIVYFIGYHLILKVKYA